MMAGNVRCPDAIHVSSDGSSRSNDDSNNVGSLTVPLLLAEDGGREPSRMDQQQATTMQQQTATSQQQAATKPPTPLPRGPTLAIVIMYFTNALSQTILFPFLALMVRSFHVTEDPAKIG